MDENDFIKKVIPFFYQSEDIVIGPGDDCAVIKTSDPKKYMLFAVDQLISSIHYEFKHSNLKEIGAKLLKRNISDIAAMGGNALYAVVSASANSSFNRLKEIYFGLALEAKKWSVSVCGGDFSSAEHENSETFSLSIIGEVEKEKLCLRSNAKPGDFLYATGTFGNSYKSKHHFKFSPRIDVGRFVSGNYTNAMMDISDGLLIDCSKFAQMSGLSLDLYSEKILKRRGCKTLKNALADGEDYELVFAVSPKLSSCLEKNWPFKNVELSKIGKFYTATNRKSKVDVLANGKRTNKYDRLGFVHKINV